jgi:hypothetical protein
MPYSSLGEIAEIWGQLPWAAVLPSFGWKQNWDNSPQARYFLIRMSANHPQQSQIKTDIICINGIARMLISFAKIINIHQILSYLIAPRFLYFV